MHDNDIMMESIHLLNDTEIREDHGEDFGEGYCISSGGSQTCDEDSGGEGAHGKFGHQRQDTMSRYVEITVWLVCLL